MKLVDIRRRMLMAAILPVTLIALLLAVVFVMARVADVDESYSQRVRSVARQLATASEYGLFASNVTHLQTIAKGALLEADVRSVAIVDNYGRIMASSGKVNYPVFPELTRQESRMVDSARRSDLLVQPIFASLVTLDDLFEAKPADVASERQLLGHVLIEFSRDSLLKREREMLLVGLAVTLGGLLLGGFLAARLGQEVILPILRISGVIDRIGRGELSARITMLPNDPLRDLQSGLNLMASSLESGRDDLEQRIATATQALREKKEEAETATLAKSRFLAAASHDLRQPTHAMGMFVARLAQLPHDAETRLLIGNLDASVRATQDLLDGLLDISRLDAHAITVQRCPFALADIFNQLRGGLTLTAQDKGLRLRVRPTPVWLMSDPTLIHRIVLNLVVNALRYTREGSVLLACRVSGDGQYARIEVRDSGIGIAPEHHQSIFKEFYQVGNTERDRGKGLGLGLNIVDRTAQLLGHRLQFRSCLGKGTWFSLEVPLVADGASTLQPSLNKSERFDDLAGLVVMVIEDDALAREALASLLASWGYVVRVADGRASALQQLGQGPVPDVIVSDYRLRDRENGIDLIEELREVVGQTIPACLMSGDTDPRLMQEARDAELTLLHKPVRPAKLRSLVRRLATVAQTDEADK